MKIEAVVNGGVTLIITPQNNLDEEILKTLNQQNNVIVEVQGTAALINKPISSGLLITSSEEGPLPHIEDALEEIKNSEKDEEI